MKTGKPRNNWWVLSIAAAALSSGFVNAEEKDENGFSQTGTNDDGAVASVDDNWRENDWEGEAYDAWVDGKLEASYLFNTELNNFKIDTDVEDGIVTLEGKVPSEDDKALAQEVAMNIEGVKEVHNRLTIDADS